MAKSGSNDLGTQFGAVKNISLICKLIEVISSTIVGAGSALSLFLHYFGVGVEKWGYHTQRQR